MIETGTGDNSYFQSRKFRGEGNAATYYHAVDFGFAGHNQVDFYEYGGLWNFWKNTDAAATTADSNLCLQIGDTYVKNKGNTFTWPTTSGTLALTSNIPTALKNPNALTFGSKTYDGSSAQEITLADLGGQTAGNYVTADAIATAAKLGLVKSSTTGTTADRNYNVQVNSDGTMKVNVPWTNTTYSAATQSAAGLMSIDDKKKLDGIAANATKVTSDTISG